MCEFCYFKVTSLLSSSGGGGGGGSVYFCYFKGTSLLSSNEKTKRVNFLNFSHNISVAFF